MITEDDESDGAGTIAPDALRLIAAILLFPVLWIGVAVNFLGLAERLSFLPGISREGGFVSGLVAILLTVVILGVIVGGASAATGGGIPIIGGGGNTPTEMKTPASTPTSTPTAAPTPSLTSPPTTTPTAAPTHTLRLSDSEQFEANFLDRLRYSVNNDTITPIPVLASAYRVTDDGTTELWVVYWQCDNADDAKTQLISTAVAFANTAGHFEGEQPDRLRVYGVFSAESYPDSIAYIPTSSAEAVFNRSMDPSSYTENLSKRFGEPTESETEIAYQMVVNDSGKEKAEKVFNEQYPLEESDRGCHVTPEGGEQTGTDQRISDDGVPIAAEPIAP